MIIMFRRQICFPFVMHYYLMASYPAQLSILPPTKTCVPHILCCFHISLMLHQISMASLSSMIGSGLVVCIAWFSSFSRSAQPTTMT